MKLFGRSGNGAATATDQHLIERLIHENGWTVDLRHGDGFALAFRGDAITPSRDVHIVHVPGNALALFWCSCRARFLASSASPVQLAMFLARNKSLSEWHEDNVTIRSYWSWAAWPGHAQ
jgi:hypothetical protein